MLLDLIDMIFAGLYIAHFYLSQLAFRLKKQKTHERFKLYIDRIVFWRQSGSFCKAKVLICNILLRNALK